MNLTFVPCSSRNIATITKLTWESTHFPGHVVSTHICLVHASETNEIPLQVTWYFPLLNYDLKTLLKIEPILFQISSYWLIQSIQIQISKETHNKETPGHQTKRDERVERETKHT